MVSPVIRTLCTDSFAARTPETYYTLSGLSQSQYTAGIGGTIGTATVGAGLGAGVAAVYGAPYAATAAVGTARAAAAGARATGRAAAAGIETAKTTFSAAKTAAPLTIAMAGGGIASGVVHGVLNGRDTTPLGLTTSFATGAVLGAPVKYGYNAITGLTNTIIPRTLGNGVTAGYSLAASQAGTFAIRLPPKPVIGFQSYKYLQSN